MKRHLNVVNQLIAANDHSQKHWQNKQSYARSYLAPNGWKAIIACLHLKKCHLKLAEEALLQQQNSYMAHLWLETLAA